MNQLLRIWASLGRGQQISLIAGPLLLLAISWGGLQWKHDSDFRPLYSGLAPEDAAAVTQKVREAGIEYKLDELGATVLVPSTRIAEARLALAAAGLPKTGRIGFELFDRNNLGASDFAEQVNYRRALEGELERTVGTLGEVEQARIHLTFARESVFLDARQPSKATVVLRVRRGAQLGEASVVAIANLMASAVEGLSPSAVSIIDSAGRLLNRPHPGGDGDVLLAESNLEYRRQVESELLAKINADLSPLLGSDRFRASVNVDCDFTSSEQSEETYDPAKSAVLTSQSTEESNGAGMAGGTPGTASNLPRPVAKAAGVSTGLLRRTDNASYQPSRVVKRTVLPKGTIRHISTAVLLDQSVRWEGSGVKAKRILVPPSAEVLKVVHDIVAGITAFTEQRGDQITIESLPFENTLAAEPPMPPSPPPVPQGIRLDFRQPVVIGGLAGCVLLLAGLVFLLTRKRKTASSAVDTTPTPLAAGETSQLTAHGARAEAERKMEQQISDNEAQQAQLEAESLSRIKLPDHTKKTQVLVKHIRDSVQKDAATATNVLRSWMSEQQGPRS